MSLPGIRKLDESVINKIAAGEIIHRPHNALKELIENCIDAKATAIQISIKDGGMKLLQINDNGVGMNKEDLDIVCERFTTSKIKKYEDLSEIQTYGFRGEALASISHVSYLTIISKTQKSNCAYKCLYIDGKPRTAPKSCAGNQGTQIVIEDLFYNLPTRKKALNQPSQEYSKICDIVTKYAIHNSHISFKLKKVGSPLADIITNLDTTIESTIHSLYGANISKDLITMKYEDKSLNFTLDCLFTDPSFRSQTDSKLPKPFILFVNHRLVECQPIKKIAESVYAETVSDNIRGGRATNFFAYIDLKVDPRNLDVNIHPTKKEVCFLHQDDILEALRKMMVEKLLHEPTSLPKPSDLRSTNLVKSIFTKHITSAGTPQDLDSNFRSKDFTTLIQDVRKESPDIGLSNCKDNELNTEALTEEETFMAPKMENSLKRIASQAPQYLNRTDFKAQKMSKFLSPKINSERNSDTTHYNEQSHETDAQELASVQALKKGIFDEADWTLTKLVREHVYVGLVNFRYSLLQHQTSLYVADTRQLTRELYYQIMVKKFGKLGRLRLDHVPANHQAAAADLRSDCIQDTALRTTIYDLALRGLENPENGWKVDHGPKEECARFVQSLIQSKSDMLEDYFSFKILPRSPRCHNLNSPTDITKNSELPPDDYVIVTLPLLIPGEYDSITSPQKLLQQQTLPSKEELPNFLTRHLWNDLPGYVLRLATEVKWDTELECFKTFAEQTAQFLASKWSTVDVVDVEYRNTKDDNDIGDDLTRVIDSEHERCREIMEKYIYPALKKYLVVPNRLATTETLVKVADLKDLYKVFERC